MHDAARETPLGLRAAGLRTMRSQGRTELHVGLPARPDARLARQSLRWAVASRLLLLFLGFLAAVGANTAEGAGPRSQPDVSAGRSVRQRDEFDW